jgi:thiosulfate/3-mercaptopyruvate sulfurtransferase
MPIILTTFLALIFAATSAPASQATHSELLVETGWLAAHLNDTNLRIVDVRSPEKYRAGHIHNAVSGPMEEVAITPDLKKAVTHELPPKQKIEAWAGSLGISNATTVILYDEGNNNWATRVFWTLEYYGHSGKVSILNGGFNKWKSEGREITGDVPKVKRVGFNTSIDESRLATKEYLLANLGKKAILILDVRSPKEYRGEDRRATRGGHIPDAVNVEWTNNLVPESAVFKPSKALEELYQGAGITKDKEVVVYCQSGMRASHTYFVLRLLGYQRVRLYDGSWQEWGNDPTSPIE